MAMLDVLRVLAEEVGEAGPAMAQSLAELETGGTDAGQCQEAVAAYLEQVQRIGTAAAILSLDGLEEVCRRVEENARALGATGVAAPQRALLARWPDLVLAYLLAPKDPQVGHALAAHLARAEWPCPLAEAEVAGLRRRLAEISGAAGPVGPGSARAVQAQAADVALDVPPEVNPALLEAFLTEGPVQAAQYSTLVQRLVHGEAASAGDINEARRLVHALKGAANTVGVKGIAGVAHHLEDVLEYLAEQAVTPHRDVAGLLLEAADCLEMMFESLSAGEGPPPRAVTTLQRLLDLANRIDRGEAGIGAGEPAPAAWDQQRGGAPAPGPAAGEVRAGDDRRAPEVAEGAIKLTPRVQVPAAVMDGILRLSGEMSMTRANVQEQLHHAGTLVAELREQIARLRQSADELERMATVQGVTAGKRHKVARRARPLSELFDALEFDQYGELHGAVHRYVEIVSDLQLLEGKIRRTLATLDGSVNQQGVINNELHEHIVGARMVSVASIEPRLQRTLRQACEATGKQARLTVHGAAVLVEDRLMNELVDPLVHMLRNAVDHGVEPPDVRRRAGKPETGAIALGFERNGNRVVITCSDDGPGLDLERIRAQALARGLIGATEPLTEAGVARLILRPGLSTRGAVSEISGRGIGMDIVQARVRKLKGSLAIQTEPGRGCRFTVRLPMVLGRAHCLVVGCAGEIVAIPGDGVERTVYAGAKGIQLHEGRWVYRDEHDSGEAYDLARLLGYPVRQVLGAGDDTRSVVVVRDGEARRAIVVDALVNGYDLVIKGVGAYLSGVRGVIGASVLGNGRVVPVVDVPVLIAADQDAEAWPAPDAPGVAQEDEPADILVVDDSLSVRLALTQLLSDAGYRVRTAKDGLEALEQIAQALPGAILVDLEMPRMDGLELTSRLRARPDTRVLPVVMLTSRSGEKHRAQARIAGVDLYLTKPYRDQELLSYLRGVPIEAA